MIANRAANVSSLAEVVAKRVAAAARLRKTTLHQEQHRGLVSTISDNHILCKSFHDDDEAQANNLPEFISAQQRVLALPNPSRFSVLSAPESSQRRRYHTTLTTERAPAIIMGLATLSALGFAGSSAIKSYEEWKNAQPTKEELEEIRKQEEQERAKTNAKEEQQQAQQQSKAADDEGDKPRTNVFREWFDVGTKYYEGGFEETMTKREAALILGVRESSSPARVKDAHRRLLILNHPDTGGSTYLAGKLNEAKELLLKGKSQKAK